MFQGLLTREASRASRRPRAGATCIIASLFAAPLANAQDVHARSPLTPSQIVAAMQDRQVPVQGVQIRLAIPITSTVVHPALEVQDITPLNQHDVRLRIACHDRSECLPFFAIASYTDTIDLAAFGIKSGHHTVPATRPAAATKLDAETSAPPPSFKPLNQAQSPLLRSGSSATLDFDGDRVHVRVAVICLQSGTTGDTIRVTTRDHKQIYLAEIVAPNALKGTLTR